MVEHIEARFPGLRASPYRVTSPATRDYNCVAWAADDNGRWWWPDADPDDDASYWPPDAPREETVGAMMAAFASLGYVPASDEHLEPGFEKVAVFARNDVLTHIARQLSSGRWTSKLGQREDIEHDLHALTGEAYGSVVLILQRPVARARDATG